MMVHLKCTLMVLLLNLRLCILSARPLFLCLLSANYSCLKPTIHRLIACEAHIPPLFIPINIKRNVCTAPKACVFY